MTLPVRDDRDRVRAARCSQDLDAGKPLALAAARRAGAAGHAAPRASSSPTSPASSRMAAGLDFLLELPLRLHRAAAQPRPAPYVALAPLPRRCSQQTGGEAERRPRRRRTSSSWLAGRRRRRRPRRVLAGLARLRLAHRVGRRSSWSRRRRPASPSTTSCSTGSPRTLEQALRSDYCRFIDGESFAERAWALAALAQAGPVQRGLRRRAGAPAQFLDLEAMAEVAAGLRPRRAERRPPLEHAHAARSGTASSSASTRGARSTAACRRRPRAATASSCRARRGPWPRSRGRVARGEPQAAAPAGPRRRPRHARPRRRLGLDERQRRGAPRPGRAARAAVRRRRPAHGVARPARRQASRRSRSGPDAPLAPCIGSTTRRPARSVLAAGAGRRSWPASRPRYVPAADGSEVAPRAARASSSRASCCASAARARRRSASPLDASRARRQTLAVGDVVEEHVQVVNPKERHYVAVVVPLAAGMEPLNPDLATAPPEAQPAGPLTLAPTYVGLPATTRSRFYYDTLPEGTYDFYFRTRATIAGRFIQPPAQAEMMYDGAVGGSSHGGADRGGAPCGVAE